MSFIASRRSVLIVGIGEVGHYILEFLVRENFQIDIVAADVNLQNVEAKINNAVADSPTIVAPKSRRVCRSNTHFTMPCSSPSILPRALCRY